MKLECKISTGLVCVYSIAYPVGSAEIVDDAFIFLGYGVIHRVDGEPYNDNTILAFYRLYPKKRYK